MTSRTDRPAPWRAALVGLASAVTLTSALGACSGSDDARNASDEPSVETSTPTPTTEEPTPTESATPSVSATPTLSESPEPASPDPTETTEPAPALTARLLPARSVTGFNEQWAWRDGETRTSEPASGTIADCIRFSLAAIGASEVAPRSYLPPAKAADSRATALQVVADFPDEQTAVRVMGVLRSWHDSCQRRLNSVSDQPHRVSDAAAPAAGAEAFAYLHSTRGSTPDTTLFEDVGQVRVGHAISLVVVRLDEQDYNYAAARTPAARTLKAAAAALAG
jgi:type IV secretory pathway VirB10-like protein